jgi:hypothetical protein
MLGYLNTIKTSYSQFLTYQQALLMSRVQYPKGRLIVNTNNRIGWVRDGEQPLGGLVTTVTGQVTFYE